MEDHWTYNCEDTVRTYEISEEQEASIAKFGLHEVNAFQHELFHPVLRAMVRGFRVDLAAREAMRQELSAEIDRRKLYFKNVLGHDLNPASPPQMQRLFYDDLQLPVQKNRKTKKPTLDDEALTKLGQREPLVRPLLKTISEYRSLGVFRSTFIEATLDSDNRMRCSYNICGTETYRFSSSENAFGSGTNLQNVPKGIEAREPEDLSLPNIRKIFIPDEGYTFFDGDLSRADIYVMAWDADDKALKEILNKGIDLHLYNACAIYNIRGIPPDELIENHGNYREHRGRIGELVRDLAKKGAHAVDYGCKDRTLAIQLGITVRDAGRFINSYLAAYPGIKRWHDRTQSQLNARRYVENKFGYRRYYFDRPDTILPEALAWVPQSTVACLINRIWARIYKECNWIEVLGQVHDSLVGQFPNEYLQAAIAVIKQCSQIAVPYDDPLIVPFSVKTSTKSWGDCK